MKTSKELQSNLGGIALKTDVETQGQGMNFNFPAFDFCIFGSYKSSDSI